MRITIPPAPPVGSKRDAQNAKTRTDARARPSVIYSYIHIHPSSTSYSIIFTSFTPTIPHRRARGATHAIRARDRRPDFSCPSTPNVRTVQIFVPPMGAPRVITSPRPHPRPALAASSTPPRINARSHLSFAPHSRHPARSHATTTTRFPIVDSRTCDDDSLAFARHERDARRQ